MSDDFKIELGLDYGKVIQDYERVIKKLEDQKVNLGFNTEELKKLAGEVGKISKTQLQIMDNGTVKRISDVNASLTHTFKMVENLKKNTIDLTISDNSTKVQKDLYGELAKLQKEEFANKKATIGANEENLKLLKQQADLIKQAQDSVKKSISENNLKNDEMQNKLIKERIGLEEKLKTTQQKHDTKKSNEAKKIEEEKLATEKLIKANKDLLSAKLQNVKTRYGALADTKEIERLTESIKKLSATNTKEARQEIQQLNAEIKKLESDAKVSGMKSKTDSMSFGDHIKTATTNMMGYMASFMAFQSVERLIDNTVRSIYELDKAMIDVKKVTDETGAAYDSFVTKMDGVAVKLGTQTTKLVEATAMWAKTGQELANAGKLAETTILGSQVGDVSVEEMQKYLVAPMTAYKMKAEETIQIVDKLNNLSNNTASDIQNMGEAINRSAYGLKMAGNTLDETFGLINVGISKTQLDGAVIGTALKSISLRLSEMKDEDGNIIPKLAEGLEKVGVAATDSAGQMRSTYDILSDLSKVWKDLDKNSQLDLAEKIGGKRHANIVAALVEDYESLNNAVELSGNSAGSAMQEHEKYQQSVQYQLDVSKQKLDEFYRTLMTDDSLKSMISAFGTGVSAVASFVDTFGAVPSAIGLATAALVIFNTKLRETMQANNTFGLGTIKTKFDGVVKAINKQQIALSVSSDLMKGNAKATAILGAKQVALKGALMATKVASVALSAALTMGLSIAITAVIGGLAKLIDSTMNARENLKEFNAEIMQSTDETKKQADSASELMYKMLEAKATIDSTDANSVEGKQAREDLLNVQKELAKVLPETATGYTKEGEALSQNLELVKQTIQLKQDEMQMNARKFFEENKTIAETIRNYGALHDKYAKYKAAKETGQKVDETFKISSGVGAQFEEVAQSFVPTNKQIDKMNGQLLDSVEIIGQAKKQVDSLRGMSFSDSEINEVLKDTGLTVEMIEGAMQDASSSADGFTNSQNDLANASGDVASSLSDVTIEINGVTYSVNEAKGGLESLSTSFGQLAGQVDFTENILKDLNDDGTLTRATLAKIFESGDTELIAQLGDVNGLKDYLISRLGEENTLLNKTKEEAINSAIAVEEGEKRKAAAVEEANAAMANRTLQAKREIGIDGNESQKINYQNDATNHGTSEKTKETQAQTTMNNINSTVAGGVSQMNIKYQNDVSNFQTAATNKENIARTNVANINSINAGLKDRTVNVNTNYLTGGSSTSASNNPGYGRATRMIESPQEEKQKQKSETKELDTKTIVKTLSLMSKAETRQPLTKTKTEENPQQNIINKLPDFTYEKVENPKEVAKIFGREISGRVAKEIKRATPQMNPMMMRGGIKPNYVQMEKPDYNIGKKKPKKKKSSGSKSSKSSKSKSSSSKDKVDIKDIEDEIDRYKELEDTLDDVNNALDMNNSLREHAKGKDKYKYHYEELKLLEQKKKAISGVVNEMKREKVELEKKLKANGFNAKDGGINNYKKRLEQLKKEANSMDNSNKAKEAAKKKYEDLKKAADRYFELTSKELPGLEKDWQDVVNQMKEAQIQMEKDAAKEVEEIRDKLVEALKNKYEEMRKNEISDLDKEIKHLQDKLDQMDKEADDKAGRMAKLKAELEKWQKDDSSYGKSKVEELKKQIEELQREIDKEAIQEEIDKLEGEKDKVNEHYDELLSDKNIYNEANKLLSSKSQEELLALLEQYAPDYAHIGEVWGESFKKEFLKQIQEAKDALDFLNGKLKPKDPPKPTTPSKPPSGGNNTPKPPGSSGNVNKGDKVKVTNKSASIYSSSTDKTPDGNWGKTIQLVGRSDFKIANISGNRVALSPNGKFPATGWIDKKYIAKFHKGGLTGKWNDMNGTVGKMAELHSGEAILNKDQSELFYNNSTAKAFETFVDYIPKMKDLLPDYGYVKKDKGDGFKQEIIFENNINISGNASTLEMKKKASDFTKLMTKQMKKDGIIKRTH